MDAEETTGRLRPKSTEYRLKPHRADTATVGVQLFDCKTKLVVYFERHDWFHSFALSVEKPLPEWFRSDPLIADAYKQARCALEEWRRKQCSRDGDGKAPG